MSMFYVVGVIVVMQGLATVIMHANWHAAGHGAHHSSGSSGVVEEVVAVEETIRAGIREKIAEMRARGGDDPVLRLPRLDPSARGAAAADAVFDERRQAEIATQRAKAAEARAADAERRLAAAEAAAAEAAAAARAPPEPKAPPPRPNKRRGAPVADIWRPPAHIPPLRPPPRPVLPEVGSGDGLPRDHPAYAAVDDAEVSSRPPRPATLAMREAATRYVGARAEDGGWPDESIFVSIASYRDPECAKTVARAYDRSARPDRVFFGIYQQNDEARDVDCVAGLANLIQCPAHAACGRVRSNQIRAYRVDWKQTLGPTIGRHMSERLFRNETYVMSFDSHTNFAAGWDAIAIDMFKRIDNPRAIITTYPASYGATEHSERWQDVDEGRSCDACRRIDDQKNVEVSVVAASQMSICRTRRVQVGRTTSFKHDVNHMKRPPRPTLVPFLAAGFNFARGSRVLEVPYDAHSHFLFDGEETSLAVRAWTHGYDFYHPDRDVVSHLYIPSKSPLRPVFWTDDWELRARIQFWTMLRINYALGLHDLLDYWVDVELLDLTEITKYGLGTRRRAVDYWSYVGVTPDRDGAEWSPGRCDVFSTTGLPAFPVDPPGSRNNVYGNYAAGDYAAAFPPAEMLEAVVEERYAAQQARPR